MSEPLSLELNGAWSVRRADGGDTCPATVPGCVHTDLLAAGRIEDPFVGDNELRLHWIGEAAWVYERRFEVPAALLGRERVLLRCEGLDTLATVSLNGREVGRTDNMFRTWEFDAKPFLKPGANGIAVRFESVLPLGRRRQQERRFAGVNADCGAMWVRKEPCNYGWDWGPRCITCGIWRPIGLVAFDGARLASVRADQRHGADGRVALDVRVAAERARASGPLRAEIALALRGKPVASAALAVDGGTDATATLEIARPELWWPRGLGAQPLYDLEVRLLDAAGAELDAWRRRIGLRRVRLVRRPDEWGESFHFEANGQAFFAKGANWIPADVFDHRVGVARLRDLLGSAAEAHMNLVRVWGGGIYEQDAFYDLCDEMGLLVWQDFMFACAAYPAHDAEFLRNVEAEAREQVRRLRHHACLALWCGNNEVEQCGFVNDDGRDGRMSWAENAELFDRLLARVAGAEDPGRDYWPSSAHQPRGNRRQSNAIDSGDAHVWDVWHGRQPFEWYRGAFHRFCTEFGFQSFPEPRTVDAYAAPADRNVTSFVMEHHQRSGIGNTVILQYLLNWFRVPRDFERTLWLSQVLQGLGIQYAVEHWRRNMPRCMGAVYWQLDDCWPVASWSSIDSFGRWKALHYFARRFFAPLLASAVEDPAAKRARVHVSNDLPREAAGEARWTATRLSGEPVGEGVLPFRVAPCSSAAIGEIDLAAALDRHGARDLLVWIDAAAGDAAAPGALVLFARPKHMDLPAPELKADVAPAGEAGAFRVVVSAARPALWAWWELEGADCRWSDNFRSVRPGRPLELTARPARAVDAAEFRRRLKLRSLVDTY